MALQTVSALINDLRTARGFFKPDWTKRIAAAQALGAQRASEAVNDLAAVIQENQNADLVRAALQALGQIGAPQAVASLITILDSSDLVQRDLAGKALKDVGFQVAGRALLAVAANPAARGREAANSVLRSYGDIAPVLVGALTDGNARVRDAARQRLAQDGQAAVPALLVASADPSPEVRIAVDGILDQLGELTPLLVQLLADRNDRVRQAARQRLIRGGQAAVPALIKALADPSSSVREAAYQTLGQFGDVTALLVAALAANDDRLRNAARERLAQSGPAAIPTLVEALSSDAVMVWVTARDLLTRLGAPSVPALAAAVRQTSGPVRTRVIQALGAIGAPAMNDLLVLMNDADPLLGQAAVEALGKIGQPALKPLAAVIASGETQQAMMAAEALVALGQPAVPELITLLGHENDQVRKQAATALLKIDSPEAQILKPALANWINAAMPPTLLVVDANGEGGSLTLEDAVEAALDTSILALRPGVHTLSAPLSLKRSLTLLGPGPEHCTVSCAGEEYVIQLMDGRLAAIGVTFEHAGPHFASAIEVAGGQIELYHCCCRGGVMDETLLKVSGENEEARLFTEQRRFTILMKRFGGEVVSRSMFIPDVLRAGSGLWLHGQARAKVTECCFTGNECDGVGAEGSVRAELVRSQFNGNKIAGITFCGNAGGRIAGNDVHDNEEHGIAVRSDVERAAEDLVIESNTCRANKGVGIGFWQQASATARGNHCIGGAGQRHGIYASEEARPLIEGNQCESHELGGISFYKEAGGTTRGNTCRGNGAGITMTDEAQPQVEENTCSDNVVGIYCGGEGAPVVKCNTCRSNSEDGIQVIDSAAPTLERNVCNDNARGGIFYMNTSEGVARANECMGNKIGIYLGRTANPVLQDNNCARNELGGIGGAPR